MTKTNGYILFEGPSALDGQPIVVIATGFARKSANGKTGDMIQTWILRSDIKPNDAVKTGDDVSICGDCPQRSANGGKCYVKTFQAPRSVYEAFHRGIYPAASLAEITALCESRMVRIGSYGDPYAAPLSIWRAMTSNALGWTGYTHQWRKAGVDWAKPVMASADSLADMIEAHKRGFRTFRVTSKPFENVKGIESVCPDSKEKNASTTCAACRACMGTSGKARASIQIARH
jgi:hypothetical protein